MVGASSHNPTEERLRAIEQALIHLLDEVHQLREDMAADLTNETNE